MLDNIYHTNCEGGLSIKKIKDVNIAMAKLGWKILINPNNFWIRIILLSILTMVLFLSLRKWKELPQCGSIIGNINGNSLFKMIKFWNREKLQIVCLIILLMILWIFPFLEWYLG